MRRIVVATKTFLLFSIVMACYAMAIARGTQDAGSDNHRVEGHTLRRRLETMGFHRRHRRVLAYRERITALVANGNDVWVGTSYGRLLTQQKTNGSCRAN